MSIRPPPPPADDKPRTFHRMLCMDIGNGIRISLSLWLPMRSDAESARLFAVHEAIRDALLPLAEPTDSEYALLARAARAKETRE